MKFTFLSALVLLLTIPAQRVDANGDIILDCSGGSNRVTLEVNIGDLPHPLHLYNENSQVPHINLDTLKMEHYLQIIVKAQKNQGGTYKGKFKCTKDAISITSDSSVADEFLFKSITEEGQKIVFIYAIFPDRIPETASRVIYHISFNALEVGHPRSKVSASASFIADYQKVPDLKLASGSQISNLLHNDLGPTQITELPLSPATPDNPSRKPGQAALDRREVGQRKKCDEALKKIKSSNNSNEVCKALSFLMSNQNEAGEYLDSAFKYLKSIEPTYDYPQTDLVIISFGLNSDCLDIEASANNSSTQIAPKDNKFRIYYKKDDVITFKIKIKDTELKTIKAPIKHDDHPIILIPDPGDAILYDVFPEVKIIGGKSGKYKLEIRSKNSDTTLVGRMELARGDVIHLSLSGASLEPGKSYDVKIYDKENVQMPRRFVIAINNNRNGRYLAIAFIVISVLIVFPVAYVSVRRIMLKRKINKKKQQNNTEPPVNDAEKNTTKSADKSGAIITAVQKQNGGTILASSQTETAVIGLPDLQIPEDVIEQHLRAGGGDISKYYKLTLTNLWGDTLVKGALLSYTFAARLDDFLADELLVSVNQQNKQVEIGGFILGRIFKSGNSETYLFFERFISFESENNGVYQIHFGAKAIVTLERAMQTYNELKFLGWFHTHPGHGVFLSPPDISLHGAWCAANYQIAMEIDTVKSALNPGYEMAVFTQKNSGQMNNSADLISGSKWFQWIKIQQWLRKS